MQEDCTLTVITILVSRQYIYIYDNGQINSLESICIKDLVGMLVLPRMIEVLREFKPHSVTTHQTFHRCETLSHAASAE